MAFKEYGSFDAVGLADLVRRKQVSASELLDEAIARTAKVDGDINATDRDRVAQASAAARRSPSRCAGNARMANESH